MGGVAATGGGVICPDWFGLAPGIGVLSPGSFAAGSDTTVAAMAAPCVRRGPVGAGVSWAGGGVAA